MKSWFNKVSLKFQFRFFAVMDIIFCSRFELKAYNSKGQLIAKTNFDQQEIEECNHL